MSTVASRDIEDTCNSLSNFSCFCSNRSLFKKSNPKPTSGHCTSLPALPCMSEDILINALIFLRSTTDLEQTAGVATCWDGEVSAALVKSRVAIMASARGIAVSNGGCYYVDDCQLSDQLASRMDGKKWSQAIISFRHDGLDPASRFFLQASDKKRNPDQVRGDGSEGGGVLQATS